MAKAKSREPIKFTKAALNKLKPEARPYLVYSITLPGLCCSVQPSGKKSLMVYKTLAGHAKPARVKICDLGELPLDGKADDTVEKRAYAIIGKLLAGINPNQEKRAEAVARAAKELTLQQALDEYLEDMEDRLAANTKKGYRQKIETHLEDWLKSPLTRITPAMTLDRHRRISKKYPYAANTVMRILRALYNYHRLLREDEVTGLSPIPEPPTRVFKLKKQWNRESRRTDYIAPSVLKDWWAATEKLATTIPGKTGSPIFVYPGGGGELARDYLQFVALTGLRRREASQLLTWDNVDLRGKTFIVPDTKNHETLVLPLSDYLVEMLKRRHKAKDPDTSDNRVFPIEEVKKFVSWVRKESGIDFTVHGLRRSFITAAESLDFGLYTIKALVNHSSKGNSNDVTSGYVQISTERLRDPMQRITDYILRHAGVTQPTVVKLDTGKLAAN